MKNALVTGASRGIGRAIAQRLAGDGYHVIINYRSNDTEAHATLKSITDSGGSGELLKLDITDRHDCAAKLEKMVEEQPIAVLVLCAGVRNDELLIFMADEQWDSVLDTNLNSLYNVARPVVKGMFLQRTGRVIAISSTSGESGLKGQVHYAAAKAGIIGAVKSLALEGAKRNVLVNAVTPGFIHSDMTEDIDEKKLAAKVPLQRFGMPEEVAGVVSFLASNDASYITGQVIRVNGGVYM